MDHFGQSVALSADGNTLLVGAPLEASASTILDGDETDNTAPGAGAAYLFARSPAGTWSQLNYIKAPNAGAMDGFGYAVGMSGDASLILISAPWESTEHDGLGGTEEIPTDDNSAPESGIVYIFFMNEALLQFKDYVKGANSEAGDHFGRSLAVSADGGRFAIGASDDAHDDAPGTPRAGTVSLYVAYSSGYSRESYFGPPTEDVDLDGFGQSVALSDDGNVCAIGAWAEASGSSGIDGNPDDNSAPNSGAVWMYRHVGANWESDGFLKAFDSDEGDQFGLSISLSGDGEVLAVGAPSEASAAIGIANNALDNTAAEAGAVYLYTYTRRIWQPDVYVKATNTQAGDRFGTAVVLSLDGHTLAIGAPAEDSGGRSVASDQADNSRMDSGAVYVVRR